MGHSILLLGKNGQLGWELQYTLAPLGQVYALDYPEVDFTRPETLEKLVKETRPAVVINAAAYTDVDGAEAEINKARLINGVAPGVLAEASRHVGAVFIHYSTDFVFDGQKNLPYTEDDIPHPVSAYGQTKWEGERAVRQTGGGHFIFRTAWVYSLRRGGFVNKVLEWARKQTTLRLVNDQVSNPTWCRMLAEISALLLAGGRKDFLGWAGDYAGLYHLAGGGYTSRFEWGRLILELDPNKEEQMVNELLPATSADFPAPAQRPLFSALDCSRFQRIFGLALPDWRQSMKGMMRNS